MPSKNAKAKVKAPPEKVYEFYNGEELKAREQRYTSRMMELRACLNFVDDATLLVSNIDKERLIANKWWDYVMCIKLPKPYKPYDMRLYLEKLKYFENSNRAKTIDWTLSVNERSLLTQNIFRKDLTRKYLKNTIKTDFGYEYGQDINNCLKVISRIEYFLDNDVEVAKCSSSILEDIKLLKTAIVEEINQFFDRYTYRILCSERAYMMSVNAISTEYCFSTGDFQIHIWCLKNVPIRFGLLDEPRILANLHELQMTLHIPAFMLQQNLSIRAIHSNFDHVSEFAKSYSQDNIVPLENLNAGIQELPECLLNEWLMQLDIQNRIRTNMIEKRQDYENKMRLFEEEEEAKKKRSKGKAAEEKGRRKSKVHKIVKPTKEPPVVAADIYPDVWEEFLAEEHDQYLKYIDKAYNPQSLGLDPDEINLKKFLILGGLYQLCYVRKPLHYDFDSFNMTWHQDEGKLEIDKKFHIPRTHRIATRRSTRSSMRRLTARNMSIKTEPLTEVKDADCPWFIITIKLPEYLCYWGEPIACHYETISKVIEEKVIETVPLDLENINPKKKQKASAMPPIPAEPEQKPHPKHEPVPEEKDLDSEYFHFLETQKDRLSTSLMKAMAYSKLSFEDILLRASLSSVRLSMPHKADGELRVARDADGILNVQDFILNEILSKPQIRHMERHLIPRIISSFKFPKELLEDELEAFKNRPKSKGGTLIRKHVNPEDQLGKKNHIFSFSQRQNNPERMFPIYPCEEPMRVVQYLQDPHEKVAEPQSFAQLVGIINLIKSNYKQRIHKITDLKIFKTQVKLVNKHLKDQLKDEIKAKLQKSASHHLASSVSKAILKKQSTFQLTNKDAVPDNTEIELKESTSDIKDVDDPFKSEVHSQEDVDDDETEKLTYTHWSNRHILKSEFDRSKCTIVLQTDRLGCIGFAFKRYEHFPFKFWKLEPSDTDPENEVLFTLETQYVACILYISGNGIRGHVTEPTKAFKRNPKMYLVIDKPIKDFTEFKKRFKDKYLNIFADHDANYYIENGYFCEKHLATEMHTYNCMAVHSSQMKFQFSQWNRLSTRRDIILQFVQFKDLPENMVQVRLTPEEAYFVEISELCSDSVDDIKLNYDLTWRNLSNYSDLHYLINSMYPAATDLRCKNPKLITCIRDLLSEIRPLSFS